MAKQQLPRPAPGLAAYPVALARACHPGPTVAVTTLAALLAAAAALDLASGLVLTLAVLTGQLTIGWSNDLLDADRDARVGRTDKPIASGALPTTVVRAAIVATLALCVVLSAAGGLRSAAVHLVLLVGSGWAYNLGLKATVWSWAPYLLAFGSLPAVVWLAAEQPVLPPVWMMVVGALLGVGAHLLNVVPDLADDAVTSIRGLPHRLGARLSTAAALVALAAASVVVVLGPGPPVPVAAWVVLAAILALALGALRAGGRAPFRATMVVAVVNVVMLLVRSP